MPYFPYITVAVFAYIAFVFFSESLNPFKASKGPNRRRQRLARSLTLLFFLISTAALLVDSYFGLPQHQLILAAVALFIVFSLYPTCRYLKVNGSSKNAAALELSRAVTTTPALTSRTDIKEPQSPIITDNSALDNVLATQELMESIPNTVEISASDEHKLEIELSIQSHDKESENLDQTIAEAEFSIADLTISETRNIAQPDLSSSINNSMTDDYDDASDLLLDLVNEGAHKSSTTNHKLLNENTSDLNDALMEKLEGQNREIEALAENNQSLLKIRESLVIELTDLKFSLKKSNAIARKSIAQRDKAIKIKNSALTLATMERKKRKLTEIKARKALLKMRNSLKELTDQTVE